MSTKAVATLADSAVYLSPGGEIQLDVAVDADTVWLSQAQMAKLFGSSQRMMSYHINNVLADKELDRQGNIQKMYIAGSDRPVALHSLDVVISVGYRVKSQEGVHFRRWATTVLRERLLKAHRQRQTERERLATLGSLATHVATDQEARALLERPPAAPGRQPALRRERARRHRPARGRERPPPEGRGDPPDPGDAVAVGSTPTAPASAGRPGRRRSAARAGDRGQGGGGRRGRPSLPSAQ